MWISASNSNTSNSCHLLSTYSVVGLAVLHLLTHLILKVTLSGGCYCHRSTLILQRWHRLSRLLQVRQCAINCGVWAQLWGVRVYLHPLSEAVYAYNTAAYNAYNTAPFQYALCANHLLKQDFTSIMSFKLIDLWTKVIFLTKGYPLISFNVITMKEMPVYVCLTLPLKII